MYGGVEDPVVSVIKSKVLQEFIPQVPEIVTFIEKQYGFNTAIARDYLQNKVSDVLAALSTPLLDEQRKRQRKIDALNEELVFVKDLYWRDTGNANAMRNEYERKTVKEIVSLKTQNSKHTAKLMALMRAFGLPAQRVKVSTAWTDLEDSVNKLLQQRQEHETMKQQIETLQEKLKEKANQLNATAEDGQKQFSERIARLSDELVAKRRELECYKTNAEHRIATLQQIVDQKNAQIETLEASDADRQARIDQLSASDAGKQARINQLTESDVSKQAQVDRLTDRVAELEQSVNQKNEQIEKITAARDLTLLSLTTARNDCLTNVSQYTAQIDALNKELNALRIKLSESTELNDRTKTCLVEYEMIKTLYERVSESLEKARAYYAGSKAAMDYNEPVTNIILDVLTKVQANVLDFSGVKIPKPKPIVARAEVQTAEIPVQEDPTSIQSPEDIETNVVQRQQLETVADDANAACTSQAVALPANTKRTFEATVSDAGSDPDWTPTPKHRRKQPPPADKRRPKRIDESRPFDIDVFNKQFDRVVHRAEDYFGKTTPAQDTAKTVVGDDDVTMEDASGLFETCRPKILTFQENLVSPASVQADQMSVRTDGNDTDTDSICKFIEFEAAESWPADLEAILEAAESLPNIKSMLDSEAIIEDDEGSE